jgi:hypothetical protein
MISIHYLAASESFSQIRQLYISSSGQEIKGLKGLIIIIKGLKKNKVAR